MKGTFLHLTWRKVPFIDDRALSALSCYRQVND